MSQNSRKLKFKQASSHGSKASQQHISREKLAARTLKQSAWWRAQIQQGICHYCGLKSSPDQLTMDHKVPLARGGTSRQSNVVAACLDCNQKKKWRTPAEMILEQILTPSNDTTA